MLAGASTLATARESLVPQLFPEPSGGTPSWALIPWLWRTARARRISSAAPCKRLTVDSFTPPSCPRIEALASDGVEDLVLPASDLDVGAAGVIAEGFEGAVAASA
jgi:hypothetical protein